MNFEAEGFWELCKQFTSTNAGGNRRLDERATSIEIQFSEDITLDDALIACIVPMMALDDPATALQLQQIGCKEVVTYEVINGVGYEGLSAILYDKVRSIYRKKGFLK